MSRWEILLVGVVLLGLGCCFFFPSRSPADGPPRSVKFNLLLWLAQGFGIGCIPFAPGTFGSLVGLVWFALLVNGGNLWFFLGGTAVGLGVSVWLCGRGEKILGQKDPGSVVMDEIVALPVCFLAWLGILRCQGVAWPDANYFLGPSTWPLTLGVFIAFRFFDVIKPWPVRQSQGLPGGWGITIDDLLAAVYVSLMALLVFWGKTAVAK
jgi:phosphatidylglycerophosphatase A